MNAGQTADTRSPSPFPAWRLPNGRASASDEDLERSIASCERWEWNGGLVVVLGVVAAVAIAAIHPQYDSLLEQWGSAIADGLVAIGVVVEIKMGRMAGLREQELKRRANERVSEANDRAAQSMRAAEEERRARTELEVQLSRRAITKAQYDELQSLRGQVPAIAVVSTEDFESVRYAQQIVKTLVHAGVDCQLSGVRLKPGFGAGGIVSVVGDVESDPLYAAFKRAGFNFQGVKRADLQRHLIFIPADHAVVCILENPSVSKNWPPDSWSGEQDVSSC